MKAGSFSKTIKVRKLEAALRVALAAQQAAPVGKVRNAKEKAARKIAGKLLATRLQVLRSRLADMQPLMPKRQPKAGLRSRIEQMQSRGIEAVLVEFGGSGS
jgi:hypothetical protein